MKKIVIFSIITLLSIISASIVTAKKLPAIGIAENTMFKNLVQGYLHPNINGWGIGLNTGKDSYLIAKFISVSVKTLPRNQILQIIREAKEGNATSWTDVRDRIKTTLDANSTNVTKGRIQINKDIYILTNIAKTDTTFTADIKAKPDYSTCLKANISAEDCESQSAKIGDMSLTKKTAEFESGKDRVWAGTMNFNSTLYTFVAVVNPRVGE